MATSFSRQRAAPSFLLVVLDSPAVDKNVAARLGLNDMASRRHAAREPDKTSNRLILTYGPWLSKGSLVSRGSIS
jgi:hypothetical protein